MTPNQAKTLDVVRERLETGLKPSFAEIGAACGTSTTTAFNRVTALIEAGHLSSRPGRYRSLELVEASGEICLRGVSSEALAAELSRRGKSFDGLRSSDRGRGGFDRGVVTCAADSCRAEVRRGHLFCRDHWFALPARLRTRILNAFGVKDVGAYEAAVTEARDLVEALIARCRNGECS